MGMKIGFFVPEVVKKCKTGTEKAESVPKVPKYVKMDTKSGNYVPKLPAES